MLTKNIYKSDSHQWYMFGRDPEKPESIIDTNQYMIRTHDRALIMDPGGVELFSAMLSAVLKICPIEEITDLFASHQDPDIISSLGLWDQALDNAKMYSPWIWESFIKHFGMDHIEYVSLPDEGGSISLGDVQVQAVPAHYLHSSGNFNIYDPEAKILMSGDIGASLEPLTGENLPLFVEDFDEHSRFMRMFHQRWMPSNRAKSAWVERVSNLDIDIMAPQHGRLFKGDDVKRFLDWFDALDVGIAR